mmetsp:Transcript_10211/g.17194  ORF Transcript_10211/g.17194 Transcript_10211/m.17194 type:complete len:193 (+) Transcript_10211:1497-2075(+)
MLSHLVSIRMNRSQDYSRVQHSDLRLKTRSVRGSARKNFFYLEANRGETGAVSKGGSRVEDFIESNNMLTSAYDQQIQTELENLKQRMSNREPNQVDANLFELQKQAQEHQKSIQANIERQKLVMLENQYREKELLKLERDSVSKKLTKIEPKSPRIDPDCLHHKCSHGVVTSHLLASAVKNPGAPPTFVGG